MEEEEEEEEGEGSSCSDPPATFSRERPSTFIRCMIVFGTACFIPRLGTDGWCSPRQQARFERLFLESNDIL